MSKLFAVGDIHGHYSELKQLMELLLAEGKLQPASDTLVFLGDYVDSGPATRQVVDQLMSWEEQFPHWVFLKGNHEDMMLDALVYHSRKYGFYGMWWGQGGKETARSYLPEDTTEYDRALMQPNEFIHTHHLEWLNTRPLTHQQDGYLFVHAGFAPRIGLEGQTENDMLWIREKFVNSNWDFDGKRVVFGHTPVEQPLVMPNKIGIDTVFHTFGKITAVELDTTDTAATPRFYFSPLIGSRR